MDNLENLDNKTLRAKCLEHGLPDVPITDTSRKLLIRRLRTAIEGVSDGGGGKSTDKQKSSRRETVHVTKTEAPPIEQKSKEKSKSPSRRKTIDSTVVPPAPTTGKISPAPAQITQRRRSGRITPSTQVDPLPIVSEATKTRINATTIAEEDSNDIVLIEDDTNSRSSSRQSRSSSLSTSPIVSTTYNPDLSGPIILEADEQDDYEEENITTRPAVNIRGGSSANTRNIERKTVYGYETKSYIPSTITTANIQRESVYSSRINQMSSRPSLISTIPKITSYDPPPVTNMNRRQTTVGYAGVSSQSTAAVPGHTSIYPKLTREDSDGDDIAVKETPYLSDFARKLTRLKAEPVDGGISTLRKEVAQPPMEYLYNRRTLRDTRYAATKHQDSIGESFIQLYTALDQKYGLKRKFFIAIIVLILIFIYVFFFHN